MILHLRNGKLMKMFGDLFREKLKQRGVSLDLEKKANCGPYRLDRIFAGVEKRQLACV